MRSEKILIYVTSTKHKLTEYNDRKVSFLKRKHNEHLAAKCDTNKKQRRPVLEKSKTFFASVLTTARNRPKTKGKIPDKMCQLGNLSEYIPTAITETMI